MRKRRVGVTARSRQNAGNQVTGTLQFVTEMAAPLELRTPAGTCGGSCKQSADGSMATRARESTGRVQSEERSLRGKRRRGRGDSALRAHEALPHCSAKGQSPLRPPAPFPSGSRFQNGGNLSRVRKPRNHGAPLTNPLRSEDATEMRERGPSAKRAVRPPSPGAARYARMRRCLILRQGASPLRPPQFSLDREGASHGSGDPSWMR